MGAAYPSGVSRVAARRFVVDRDLLEAWLPPAMLFVAIVATASDEGAYFAPSWGWTALAFGWVATVVLILRSRLVLTRAELLMCGALAAYAGWTALSAAWSWSPGRSVLAAERALVYPLGLLAFVVVVQRVPVRRLVGAASAAIVVVSAYSLGTRLLPDRIGVFDSSNVASGYRLGEPVGYWNGLGIFAAIGVLLAVGQAAHGKTVVGRALAGASLVVLMPVVYFTFGRGAWVALAAAVVALVAFDPRRVRTITAMLAAAPAVAASVLLSSRADGLTEFGAPFAAAVHDGHRLVPLLLLLAAAAGLCVAALAIAERRLRPGERVRRAYAAALALVAATSLVVVFVHYGSPVAIADRAYEAFKRPPDEPGRGESNNTRLLSFSGNGRVDLWHAAWAEYRAHPWSGSGADTYELYWLQHRPSDQVVRNAHSVYLETLAELGPVGLLLLSFALLVPFAGAVRARREPLVPALAAGYLAFVVHVGADWEWVVPGVGLAGIFCGAILLVAARPDATGRTPSLPRWFRSAAVTVAVAAWLFAIVGLLGNVPLDRAAASVETVRFQAGERNASKAIRWMPWGAEAWQVRGRAERGLDRRAEARRSFLVAIDRSPREWSAWFDLGTVSRGRAATCAYVEAARLNPLDRNVDVLRQRGILPKDPARDGSLRCVPRIAKSG